MLPVEVVLPVAGHMEMDIIDYPFRVLASWLVVVGAISPWKYFFEASIPVWDPRVELGVLVCKLVLDMLALVELLWVVTAVVWGRVCRPTQLQEGCPWARRCCPRHSGASGPAVVRVQPVCVQIRSCPRHSGAPGPAVVRVQPPVLTLRVLVRRRCRHGPHCSGAPGPAVVGLPPVKIG